MTALAMAAMGSASAVLMPEAIATGLGIQSNDAFTLDAPSNQIILTLAGTMPGDSAGAALMFTDIAVAQQLLNKQGRLDSIDLILEPEQVQQISAWLPPALTLVEASTRSATMEQMSQAFHVNLMAMSLLALLVAALLIYNTVSLSVLDRRSSFGVLRSLGSTRAQVSKLILLENVILGFTASVAGTAAGLLLGSFLVKLVTRTIDDLYFNLSVTQFLIEPLLLLKGMVWGTGITLLAAALPAWQAGRSPPVTLQQKGVDGAALQRKIPLLSLAALILLCAGVLVLMFADSLVSGFVALNLLIFGFCLLVPLVLQWVMTLLLYLGGAWLNLTWRMALRSIQSGLDRTALAVAALTVAVSVTVGVGIMVGSFRDTVILWLGQTLNGDMQLTRLDDSGGINPQLEALVALMPEVARISHGYLESAESSLGPVRVQSFSGPVDDWLFVKATSDRVIEADNRVQISEPMAWLYQLQLEDSFTLYTSGGAQSVVVSAIFYDYTTGNPMLAMTENQLQKFWPQAQAKRLTLYLQDNIDTFSFGRSLRQELAAYSGNYGLAMNSAIRGITLAIFDRTFAITHVLRLLAIVVAFVGVLSAMLALQLQRMRDYAVLRASGMTIREVHWLIVAQTVVMGVLAGLLAIPLGLLMSEVLIDVINQRSFGWSMQHSLPSGVLLQAVLLASVAALLAGIYPARRVAAVQTAMALRQE